MMSTKRIKAGDIIRDSYGCVAVVICEDDEPPTYEWLSAQIDERMRSRDQDERWLTVYPMTGGSALSPQSLTTRLRSMTDEDFCVAYRAANGFAKDKLSDRFPGFFDRM